MGKKTKIESDPKLARSHAAGASFEVVQIALHDLGMIYVQHPIYWALHARYANSAYKRLKRYIDQIMESKPSIGNVRSIHDANKITKIYKATFDLVVHSYLTYEYFVLFILTTVYLYPGATEIDKQHFEHLQSLELKDKLKFIIINIINKPELIESRGYSMLFSELEQARHSLNHPKNDNTYNCGDTTWDKVPLAWGVSGKSIKFFDSSARLFNGLYEGWELVEPKYRKPGVLTGVKRGIKSLHTSFVKRPKKKERKQME